jgi:hypothetical protein
VLAAVGVGWAMLTACLCYQGICLESKCCMAMFFAIAALQPVGGTPARLNWPTVLCFAHLPRTDRPERRRGGRGGGSASHQALVIGQTVRMAIDPALYPNVWELAAYTVAVLLVTFRLALVYWAAKGERDRSGRCFVTKVRHRGGRERRVDVG